MAAAGGTFLASGIAKWLNQSRSGIQAAVDGAAWAVALSFATCARYDFNLRRVEEFDLALMIPIAGLVQLAVGILLGLYTGRWRFGSFDEVSALGRAALVTTAVVFAIDLYALPEQLVPKSAVLGSGFIALVLMGGVRYAWRLALESARRPRDDGRTRMLVFGAGEGGAQVLTKMLRDPDSPYLPIGLLDDDRSKRNLRISGIRVVGTREDMAAVAAERGADALLIAIPSATAEVIRDLADVANDAGLTVKVLPPVGELFGEGVGLGDIRDVTPADLLGRHEIETDVDAIAGYLTGKRVLVTGAGGSIGSELCRQIYRFAPERLVMLDRDESALHAVQLSIEGKALLDSPNLALCDIRDDRWLQEIFDTHRPQVVFHAAALKHLPLLELHPAEAVKSNVLGTLAVLEASAATGVEKFVNISTDKAADPVSVLGDSKRIAERITTWYGDHRDGAFLSVRFGNVLASRGSVLETFQTQIEAGGPVTVTHPDVTRYFMTIPEAVELVIQAGAIGRDGEALVLDMGQPVRILDVAKRLVAKAERPVKIHFTGLRAGEKLHEVLLGEGEPDDRPAHPLISHVRVAPLDPAALGDLPLAAAPTRVVDELRRHCGTSVGP